MTVAVAPVSICALAHFPLTKAGKYIVPPGLCLIGTQPDAQTVPNEAAVYAEGKDKMASDSSRRTRPTGAVKCSVVMVPMRDGVKLSTEVYRPAAAGRYPVILQRSPYYNAIDVTGCKTTIGLGEDRLAAIAAQGYVVITQEARGTSRSEGTFRPFVQEGNDGYDAIEWAARQPWSTGKVGMYGGSYLGIVQWTAAIKRPPHLTTIVPSITPTAFDQGLPYTGSAFSQATSQQWSSLSVGLDQFRRKLKAQGASPIQVAAEVAARQKIMLQAMISRSPGQTLPLGSDPAFINDVTPWIANWLAQPTLDSYWKDSSAEDKYPTISIPVLNLGAFYDIFIWGAVAGYTGMHERAATPQARANARLVLAGGGHSSGRNHYIGDLTFGAEHEIPNDLTMRWFDYWLKGIDNGVMKEPAVKLFVMLPPDQGSVGSGFWATGDSFPLPGTQTTHYYLGGGHANTLGRAGTLSLNPSKAAGSDQYRYDPANPAPTYGGAWSGPALLPKGRI
ncbi:MAG: CocE/NonD family hydrolase [Sphingomonas sp.]